MAAKLVAQGAHPNQEGKHPVDGCRSECHNKVAQPPMSPITPKSICAPLARRGMHASATRRSDQATPVALGAAGAAEGEEVVPSGLAIGSPAAGRAGGVTS
jgi:hypothetical protein